MPSSVLFVFLVLLVFSNVAFSQSIIKTLPGFDGDLPFTLETGYVGMGYMEEVQLFYYFIESERSPGDDPLVLWLTGGPGCSGFSALVYENGPLSFNYANSSWKKPSFLLRSHSWTKWLVAHPKFLKTPLYIAGDSYSGISVPLLVQEISAGMEKGNGPAMNLEGYILGNPLTDWKYDWNWRIAYAHQKALLSDELYESIKKNCKGEHWHPDRTNEHCITNLQAANEGTVQKWERCSTSLRYSHTVRSTIQYHKDFTNRDLRALIYRITSNWRPWFVRVQVAGERVTQLQNTSLRNVLS
ncbi:hypothetical protein Tsubulata_004279 [Turnera subulata]|uniref:Uncharacterized protein n=1 Tax=Turnera subulata TaxID=218843 RepID=A0A9Q0F3L0_9ROSI|nr:hypothetical protein Tsubulata_004279 [Turnera subulata]